MLHFGVAALTAAGASWLIRGKITSAAEQKTVGIGDTLPSVPCFHNSPKDSVDLSKLFENKTGA